MATRHQLQPLPLESRGGQRRWVWSWRRAASAAGDWNVPGVGSALWGWTQCADLTADVFFCCAEGHRYTASGRNDQGKLSSALRGYNPAWTSSAGRRCACRFGSAAFRVCWPGCCCGPFPWLTGVTVWLSPPQGHPACFTDAQQLTETAGTRRRCWKAKRGRKTGRTRRSIRPPM